MVKYTVKNLIFVYENFYEKIGKNYFCIAVSNKTFDDDSREAPLTLLARSKLGNCTLEPLHIRNLGSMGNISQKKSQKIKIVQTKYDANRLF